jgi:hypothetical protein
MRERSITESLGAGMTVLVERAPCSQSKRRYLSKLSEEVGLDLSEMQTVIIARAS